MVKKAINVFDAPDSAAKAVPVRRRRSQGRQTTAVSVTLPNELNQTINGIIATTRQSRSEIISDLIEKGLK